MGIIGLGLGVHRAQIIRETGCFSGPNGDMNAINSSLVGWWDASDISTLQQNYQDDTNPVTADGQAVGRIHNKATSPDRLGNFLRETSTNPGSVTAYKENGANGNSYLEVGYNGAGANRFHSSAAAGYGGIVDGTTFSTANFNTQAFTTFTVIHGPAPSANTTRANFQMYGIAPTSGAAEAAVSVRVVAADMNYRLISGNDAGGTVNSVIDTYDDVDEIGLHLVTSRSSAVAGETTIRVNAAQTSVTTAAAPTAITYDLNEGWITLLQYCGNPTCTGAGSNWPVGTKWYETIVFNSALTDEEIECVENYLMAKYFVTPIVGDLVGHWDFSDISTLYQGAANFNTPVTTDGQSIGRVKNIAPGDSNGDKLGDFLRSPQDTDSYKPVYKTGGRNNQSYAQFNTDPNVWTLSSYRQLVAGASNGSTDFTDWGGASATAFSNLILNNQAQTVFFVWQADINQYFFSQIMYRVTGHEASASNALSRLTHGRDSASANVVATQTVTGGALQLNTPVVSYQDQDHHFTMFKFSPDANGSFVKTDWVQEATGTTLNEVLDLDSNLPGGGSGCPTIQVGGVNLSEGVFGSNYYPFAGRIYEIMHFSRTLTDAEIANIQNYLSIKYAPTPPTFVTDQLVGWWDFTDDSSMWQSRNATGSVTANNDPIGRINNKAGGDSNGYKLGQFLRAYADSSTYRPTYKTGGVNGHSYGQFNDAANSDPLVGLRGGYFTDGSGGNVASNLDGGISANQFSNLTLNANDMTVYAVIDNVSNAGTGSKYVLGMAGYNTTDTDIGLQRFSKLSSDKTDYTWGGGGTNEDVEVATVMDTGLHLIKVVGDSTASIDVNGVQEDTEVIETNIQCNLTKQSNNTNGRPFVDLGCYTGPSDAGLTGFAWEGKIYEIFVYSKTLDANEQTIMNNYLITKYGQIGSILPVTEAVGHWDFTESSNLHQNMNGTTDVTTAGDRIGHVLNIAPGDINGNKLGAFLNASDNTNVRPTYKTGGLNSHSYAKFNEAGDLSCLRGGNFDGIDSTTTGGIAADVFSNLEYNMTERTIFMMVEADSSSASTVEMLFQMHGSYSGNDLANRRETIARWIESGVPNGNKIRYNRYDNSGNNFPLFDKSDYTDGQVGDGPTLIASRNRWDGGGLSTGDLQFWLNDNENINSWNWYTTPTYMGLQAGNAVGYNRPTVSIGAHTSSGGTPNGNEWDGDIYEVIVFNRALTDTEMSQMSAYFQTKYALDFTAATLPVISDHVGHWDFTDASSLKQLRNNTTAVAADGNPIGRVNNLAPGDASGDKLGAFLRGEADDATRPVWKTDGINEKGYAQFGVGQGLRAGYFSSAGSDEDGGETATKFSDLQIKQYSCTHFIVAKHDLSSITPPSDSLYSFRADDNETNNNFAFHSTKRSSAGNDALQFANSSQDVAVNYSFNDPDPLVSDVQLIMIKAGPGLDGQGIYLNGTLKVEGGTAVMLDSKRMYMDDNQVGRFYVAMGCGSIDSDGTISSADSSWEGDIYEVLTYNKVLSDDEIAQVEEYISAKYGLSIS